MDTVYFHERYEQITKDTENRITVILCKTDLNDYRCQIVIAYRNRYCNPSLWSTLYVESAYGDTPKLAYTRANQNYRRSRNLLS